VVAMSVGLQLARRREPPRRAAHPTPVADATPPERGPSIPTADDASAMQPPRAPAAAAPASAVGVRPTVSSIGATPPSAELSQREREVLRRLAEGLSNKQIARALSVSENTVKTHLANVYAKLGVGRRTEAARAARERGLA
uniref:response regulator transcription factor n=1 Tax=Tahibacter caeni TaxID=1453545 RepID=UPI0021492E65